MLSPPYTIVPTKVTVPLSAYLAAKFKEGILAPELGDDVIAILLRAEALPFEHFHNRRDLPHVGDGRFFDRHALACGAVSAHGLLSPDSCTSRLITCSTRLCVCFSIAKVSRPYSWPWTQRTIAAATTMLSSFGKSTVKEHVCPTRRGTSPESFHPISERFQTVPCPWNRPAWYVTEQCTGKRW